MAHYLRNHKMFDTPIDNMKLQSQQIVLEKISAILLENLDHNIFQRDHLKLYIVGVQKESDIHKSKCRNVMLEIKNSLKSLAMKSFVLDLDEKFMEDFLFDLADNITSLKETNLKNIETLAEQEKRYRSDLEALDRRMVDLTESNINNKTLRSASTFTAKRRSALIPAKQHEEVEMFDKFLLRTGGHTGGWNDDDHVLFLRHWAKNKGQALADNLHGILPDIPLEVIRAHEEWYIEYDRLKSKQKERINAWRDARKKIPVVINDAKEPPRPLQLVGNTQLADKKRQQIKEWKMLKLKKQLLQKQNEQEAKKKADESLQSKMRKEQELQRQSVLLYKQQKRQEEETKREITRDLKRREQVADSKLITMFQERDREYVRRCEDELRAKAERAVIKRRPKVTADRDPERLMRPTAVWQSRLKQRDEPDAKDSTSQLLHLRNLPRLKVPAWRQLIT